MHTRDVADRRRGPIGYPPFISVPNVRVRYRRENDESASLRDLRDYDDTDGIQVGIPQSVPFVLPVVRGPLAAPSYTHVRDRGEVFPPDFQNPANSTGLPSWPEESECYGGDPPKSVPWTPPAAAPVAGVSSRTSLLVAKQMGVSPDHVQALVDQLGADPEQLESLAATMYSPRKQPWLSPEKRMPLAVDEIRERSRAVARRVVIEEIECDPVGDVAAQMLLEQVVSNRGNATRVKEGGLGSADRPYTVGSALERVGLTDSATLRVCRD